MTPGKCLLGFSISNAAAASGAQSPAGGSFFACFIMAFQQHYFFPSFTLSMSSSRTSKVKEENWEIARGNLVYDPIDFATTKNQDQKSQLYRHTEAKLYFGFNFDVPNLILLNFFMRFLVHLWFIYGQFQVHFESISGSFGPFLVHLGYILCPL